ncbi:RNA polymerase sigma-70 factor, ECF subfamily [Mesorhizobium albiziae]|uniref:RNA polymerase sigma-70 factor, ECF subfamily n=2 Tax=Neomesorhizobium albiziae TaxID=335020 RepID=A0A1I4AIB0_9HYPH|nr:DNA-directed RNA polymerase sigma-70 factor [Mesorhizobium albiziae]SFK55920.1 RNA polymerase sigma-70 factor, ECF subfamily [Mesorhizobium albiziae]
MLRPRAEAMARRRVGCAFTAEDIMQDTWIKLANVRRDDTISNPAGFAIKTAMNAVVGHFRKQRRRTEIDAEVNDLLWQSVDELSPERIALGRDVLRVVDAALKKMPERSRRIFLMNRLGGVSHREIARRLGISEEAVYYHIRRVVERLGELRDQLEK